MAEVLLLWKPDCGEAMRGAQRCWDLPTGHRPHRPGAGPQASHHFNTAFPCESTVEVSGSPGSGPETPWGRDNGESLPPHVLQARGVLMLHSRVPTTLVFAYLRGGGSP